MTSKTIICANAAASFSFASLSFADNDDRRGPQRGDAAKFFQRANGLLRRRDKLDLRQFKALKRRQ